MSSTNFEIERQIDSVKASFAIEGIALDADSVAIGRRILSGETVPDDEVTRKIDQRIAELARAKANQA